jgi:hypothetical protein
MTGVASALSGTPVVARPRGSATSALNGRTGAGAGARRHTRPLGNDTVCKAIQDPPTPPQAGSMSMLNSGMLAVRLIPRQSHYPPGVSGRCRHHRCALPL